MKKTLYLILALFLILHFFSCQEDDPINLAAWNSDVAIYLIKDFNTMDGTYQIDESSIRLSKQPLIWYKDIEKYNAVNFTFILNDQAMDRLKILPDDGHQLPFAVLADDKLIYTGYFWTSYSSGSCDWVTADPLIATNLGEMRVQLGYPGAIPSWDIPDRRNDTRMLKIFARDHKLIY